MRAVVVEETGGPDVLRLKEVDQPTPGEGQLLVEVAAAGVNYIDVQRRSGGYESPTPFVPGVEGAGRVIGVGPGVQSFAESDLVGWASADGSYAEQVLVTERVAVPLPDGLEPESAAAVLLQGMTAHYLAHSTYRVGKEDTVLVHAAAGGVGLLLTQITKHLGARLIGTVSTEEKEKIAREAGADEIIRYSEVDFADEVRGLTDGRGVDAVYDGVGRATFEGSLACLRPRGVLALYGQASGPVPPVNLRRLEAAGSVFVTRPGLRHHVATREELLERSTAVLAWVLAGKLQVRIGGRYKLEQAAVAHEDLEGRRTAGKLLLVP